MATSEELMSIVGIPVDSEAVRTLVVADALTSSSEEDLEEGEPVRSHLSNPSAGYQLMLHSGRVSTAFLYAQPDEGFVAFPGPLPGGLPAGVNRTQVRAKFGIPEKSGEPFTCAILGSQGAWDRFVVNGIFVHFQYTDREQWIRLVTIMAASDAP